VNKNPILTIERNLNNILKRWLQNNYISKQVYYSLYSSDFLLPKSYELAKIHKENTPFRIIVSTINTALYPIATHIGKIISNNIPILTGNVKNSFEFYSLSEKNINNSDILIFLDVTSLFTNIPLDLATDSISKRWIHTQHHTKIPKHEFILALNFILTSTFFNFNNIIYKQTYGTPGVLPISDHC